MERGIIENTGYFSNVHMITGERDIKKSTLILQPKDDHREKMY
jgi:hypothetical protein